MSSSCQSIATAASSAATTAAAVSISVSNATSVGSLIAAACNLQQPPTSHYVNGTGSLGRLKFHHKSLDASDEELEYTQLSKSTHILGRYKSERFLASKPDEDRRRRTIIVEKKNDSYGFTLQSYGIHYKCDEELEMITYVDYVEYGGPAYRAGMREGDVILSINGNDMEKADHKTIVEFIKKCDMRMRMVVLFEDCVRKVDLHMRYIQLQTLLQQKMNELERVHLRERELLEGKWKTHSLPARKKANANTSPSDAEGISPTESTAVEAGFYRPALSTEDVPNLAMRQQPIIIPPPAQFMLTYHYLDPTYRYVLRPTTHGNADNYIEGGVIGLQRSSSSIDHQVTQQQQQQQHYMMQRTESLDTNTASQGTASTTQQYHSASQVAGGGGGAKPPAPPPRTCEKHKPPAKPPKLEKSKHCHAGHSCNPCVGHFRWKSSDKSAEKSHNNNGDNVSLDAYDLASPCCDTQCVPSRRRHRQHKEHVHKHKHRERERSESKHSTASRGNSQTQQQHASPSAMEAKAIAAERPTGGHHHHHHHHRHRHDQTQQPATQSHHHYHHQTPQGHSQTQSQAGSVRSRYFDLASGLASHCSLHSCTSSEFAPADSASYTTSISTDTLFWDPKSDAAQQASRQQSTKSRQSYEQQPTQQQQQQLQQQMHQQQQQPHPHVHAHHHHQQQQQQQHYHVTTTQMQPSQIYPNTMTYVQKPKSWDNLANKALVGQSYGYGYLDTVAMTPPVKLQLAQQRHSMPRRNPYGRFSTYGDVENYAPPPTEFVGELTTTTTTTITAKSTEELLAACDCLTPQQQQALKAAQYQLSQNQKLSHHNTCQMGYYSHLPRPTADVGISVGQQPHQTTPSNNGCDVSTVSEATRL
ncbi:LOW QUALITY PROTEIN: uncharacterized protein LOC133843013 [Drosophila sulfurigaster albostrigata]|uniref:LOW QUALITY PROTEIN: uncharacterized protein LOC133843013 n=1 Tax=Drosophila sulfurigaster albostrigata TaxID=89887 RepID=UPI002D21C9F7|nr:LOW QUALITY PROTEIN: uncharacterized protein LOC133843013 [Drosophila sulfurigaster albostrigata]